jgi:hypothetical protein
MDEDKHESTSPKTAGQKAAETKGRIERVREATMAAWTRKNGKNDALNPYSKQNYPTEIARRQVARKIGPCSDRRDRNTHMPVDGLSNRGMQSNPRYTASTRKRWEALLRAGAVVPEYAEELEPGEAVSLALRLWIAR